LVIMFQIYRLYESPILVRGATIGSKNQRIAHERRWREQGRSTSFEEHVKFNQFVRSRRRHEGR
jgi:hypothetical protein